MVIFSTATWEELNIIYCGVWKKKLLFITFIFSQLNISIDVAKGKYNLNSNALVNAMSSSQSDKELLTSQAPKVKLP